MEQTPATGGAAMSDAPNAITNRGYHAHIYYDPAQTRPTAERLCAVLGQQYPVQVGGFRDEPVGPHPVANVQIIFTPEQFQPVVEWLMRHRDGLDVLIHPLTDDSVADHSRYALWLGAPVPLKLDTLRGHYRPELLPSA
jgi:DOPA 4,5-dioxygenase